MDIAQLFDRSSTTEDAPSIDQSCYAFIRRACFVWVAQGKALRTEAYDFARWVELTFPMDAQFLSHVINRIYSYDYDEKHQLA